MAESFGTTDSLPQNLSSSNGIWLKIRSWFPFFTHCTKANVTDDQGLIEMLKANIDYFKAKPVNIPKTTILVDHAYHPATISQALQELYPQVMTKIRFERSPKPSLAEKEALCKSGERSCRDPMGG